MGGFRAFFCTSVYVCLWVCIFAWEHYSCPCMSAWGLCVVVSQESMASVVSFQLDVHLEFWFETWSDSCKHNRCAACLVYQFSKLLCSAACRHVFWVDRMCQYTQFIDIKSYCDARLDTVIRDFMVIWWYRSNIVVLKAPLLYCHLFFQLTRRLQLSEVTLSVIFLHHIHFTSWIFLKISASPPWTACVMNKIAQ